VVSNWGGPYFRSQFINKLKENLPQLHEKLVHGGVVGDVGCGAGEALLTLAKNYPNSQFHGYEISTTGLQLANKKQKEMGLKNIQWHVGSAEEVLPKNGSLDFIFSSYAFPDFAKPQEAIKAIYSSLKSDGIWLDMEPICGDTFEETVQIAQPSATLFYLFSTHLCLATGLGADGKGTALGGLGYSPSVARKYSTAAGFKNFKQCQAGQWGTFPANVYEIRKQ